jgi:hypothetical protein
MRENVQVRFNKSMPADFEKCIAEGGKVITKRLNADEYIHACKDKNGKWHEGEVKKYKKLSSRKLLISDI